MAEPTPVGAGTPAAANEAPSWLSAGPVTSGAAAEPDDFEDLAAIIHRCAVERPRHPAAILDSDALSYAALDQGMDRVAAALQRDGLSAGAVIAICAETSLDYLVVMLGALRAGVAFVPLPAWAGADVIAAMVADAGATHLFLDTAQDRRLPAMPGVRRIGIGASAPGSGLEGWLGTPHRAPLPVRLGAASRFAILYSSGTTGVPKGIVQSHGMRWVGLRGARALSFGAEAISLVSTPLYSNTTLVGLLPTLAYGGTAVLMRKFDVHEFLRLSQLHHVTHAMLVPVQYARITADSGFPAFDLSSYRWKFCTSAPFPAALKAAVVSRWPGHLLEFYGMTEGGATCALLVDAHPDKLATVGRPLPGHDIRILDEQGRELGPGTSGEIVGRSPGMMDGYHDRAGESGAAHWHDAQGRRFIRTGDIGHFDHDGFLHLTDRKKDLIISGGFNVFPSDLEAVLLRHPGIAEAAVAGFPSRRWGETPVAFVFLAPGCHEPADVLLEWANDRLGKFQRLAALRIVAELPRNPLGKVLKRELLATLGSEPLA